MGEWLGTSMIVRHPTVSLDLAIGRLQLGRDSIDRHFCE